jgi:hypothetical protein
LAPVTTAIGLFSICFIFVFLFISFYILLAKFKKLLYYKTLLLFPRRIFLDLFNKCYEFTRADEVKSLGLYPYFRPIEENEGPVVQIEGRKVIMAGSNNYLGLTAHPKVKEAARIAVEKYGTGCSGSRYLTGTLDLHIELEDRLAKFFKSEAVLLFSTGYQTAQGILPNIGTAW